MKKFEYGVITSKNNDGFDLNDYGKNGWELIIVIDTNGIAKYFFKRELIKKSNESTKTNQTNRFQV